jgi:hypothetical protein
MSDRAIWSSEDESTWPAEKLEKVVPQVAGLRPKASVKFTLHVHLDDGTVKDISCVGDSIETREVTNDHRCI